MEVVIDRFEGKFAVCEQDDRSMVNIDRALIPEDAVEGDVLEIDDESIIINRTKTKERKQRISKMMETMWE